MLNERIFPTPQEAAAQAAQFILEQAHSAVVERGRFSLAVSGGTTPWLMLELLAALPMPWSETYVVQVDERRAPAHSDERNLARLTSSLLDRIPSRLGGIVSMPVEDENPAHAAELYASRLREVAGDPITLDLVQLGLGEDGHTASLVPGDPVLFELQRDVSWSAPYRGVPRMTLTYPVLNRARAVMWVVTGPGKGPALSRLRHQDPTIPATAIRTDHAILFSDLAADRAAHLSESHANFN